MPSRRKRAMRRERGSSALPALIVILLIAAAALVVLLMQSDPFADPLPAATIAPDQQNFVDQRQATAQPLVLGAQETALPTAAPSATPQIEATQPPEEPAQQEQSDGLIPAAAQGDYFLPVFDRALRSPDDEMMIAVTIDGCDKADVLDSMVRVARKYDAQLTLFPTGEALMNEELQDGFRTCVRKLGYELENHGYSGKGEYKLSNSELALQLWKQSIAASYALGRDYQQHFYRPIYKGSDYDQRTHFFIAKLGYLGIGSYTHSYKQLDAADLAATLENGNIYQFDMSEKSLALFEAFVSTASGKGYKLVTMNELFGLGENEISSSLTIDQQTLPTMDDYSATLYDLKLNDRTHAVYRLQARLMELGYLSGEDAKADGLYGPNTSIAVSAFQADVGEPATGNADVATQTKLYG